MFKKLWGSSGSAEADNKSRGNGVSGDRTPTLTESDYEFLFLQLLEGLAHGWQQPRIVSFFEDIEDRISKQQWLDWLNGFGARMLAAAAPDNNLAARMVQLGEMQCGAIGDLAYDVGMKVLTRGQQTVYVDFNTDEPGTEDADILEFVGTDFSSTIPIHTEINDNVEPDSDEAVILEFAGADAIPLTGGSANAQSASPLEEDLVPNLPNSETQESETEVREVSLEEFMAILQQDPELARGIGQELGLDSPDPQLIIQALVAQAQAEEPKT